MTNTKLTIKRATKSASRARIALDGPAGSGKTFTALELAHEFAKLTGGKVLVIDTERGSAAKYAGEEYFGGKFNFDVLELVEDQGPLVYCAALRLAADHGYAAVVVDSLSHAWVGRGGALEQVDQIASNSPSKNSYYAWRNVTPQHSLLVDTMLQSPFHLIATLRVKTEFVEVKEGNKTIYQRVGLASIQRDGLEYEFDVVGDINLEHETRVSKTRCRALNAACVQVASARGTDYPWLASTLTSWLSDGATVESEIVASSTVGEIAAQQPVPVAPMKVPAAPAPKPPTFVEMLQTWRLRLGVAVYEATLDGFAYMNDGTPRDTLTKEQKFAVYNALVAAPLGPITPNLAKPATKGDALAEELSK